MMRAGGGNNAEPALVIPLVRRAGIVRASARSTLENRHGW
jgi:hypothetical protein